MTLKITEIFGDITITKSINSLMNLLYTSIKKINNSVVIRNNKIDFFDLFYYLVKYNSNTSYTHQQNLLNYNIDLNKNIEKNTFTSRLEKLVPEYIKNLNNELISFYYDFFKIERKNLTCSVDGSNVKFLAHLKEHFKLNKNELYTNGYLSCVYDVDNEIPIYYDIFKSPNEINNFKWQIKDDKFNMTFITDRGYDDIKLLNYYLSNNMFFISRIVKNNSFTKELVNGNTLLNEKIFNYQNGNTTFRLKIVKYCNIKKPDILENKNDLIINNNNITIKINEAENELKALENEKINLIKNIKNSKKLIEETKNVQTKKNINKNIRMLRQQKKNNKDKIKNIIEKKINLRKNYLKNKEKITLLEDYEHSEYFILTNNINLSLEKLKEIYKKRWMIETEFKNHKTILNLNQMNNKNINIIKQNIYTIQFISVISAFLKKIFEKYIKDNFHINNKLLLTSIHDKMMLLFYKILINKKISIIELKNFKKISKDSSKDNIKKNIDNNKIILIIIRIFYFILKEQIKEKIIITKKKRIKKRQNNNKFNYREPKF